MMPLAPPTAAELGLMAGSPPADGTLVTRVNWCQAPFNRWSFQHVGAIMPTARIWRGDGLPSLLEREPVNLDRLRFETTAGVTTTVADLLSETYTDAFLVLHRGRIASETYFNGMTPSTRHLLMSVSKSLTGTLAGILMGRGVIGEDDLVVDVLEELKGTSFEGATVRHLLDMRSGTRFIEDYDDPQCDAFELYWVSDWTPPPPGRASPGLFGYLSTLENERPHGGAFAYRSILTDVLGWLLSRAAGCPLEEAFSRELWSPIGAEEDAEITVDAHGGRWVDGGICVTLRDLGRIGQLYIQDGFFNGRQILPVAWVRDTQRGGEDSRAAFGSTDYAARYPGGFYRNQWWIIRPEDGVYMGSGVHGQQLYVNGPGGTVIAKLSSLPVEFDDEIWANQIRMFDAIAGSLA